jgi:hypothetical protein
MLENLNKKTLTTDAENSMYFKDIGNQRVQDNLFINKQNLTLQEDYNNKFALVNQELPTFVKKSNLSNITMDTVNIKGPLYAQNASFNRTIANVGMDRLHVSDNGWFDSVSSKKIKSDTIESPFVNFGEGNFNNVVSLNGKVNNLDATKLNSLDGYFSTLNSSNISSQKGHFDNLDAASLSTRIGNFNTGYFGNIESKDVKAHSVVSDLLSSKDTYSQYAKVDNLNASSVTSDKSFANNVTGKEFNASNMMSAPYGFFTSSESDYIKSKSIKSTNITTNDLTSLNTTTSNLFSSNISVSKGNVDRIVGSHAQYSNIMSARGTFNDIAGVNATFSNVNTPYGNFESIKGNDSTFKNMYVSGKLNSADSYAQYFKAPSADFDNVTISSRLNIPQKKLVDFGMNGAAIGTAIRSTDNLDILGSQGKVSIYDNLHIQSNLDVSNSATINGKLCVGLDGTNCVDSGTFNKPSVLSNLKLTDKLCVGLDGTNCVDSGTFNKPSVLSNLKLTDKLCVGADGTNCVDAGTFNKPSTLTNLKLTDKLCIGATCVTEERLQSLLRL